MKTDKLGTKWNWQVFERGGDVVYGYEVDGRTYRVAKDDNGKHWRADLLGMLGHIWEALTPKKYMSPKQAAKEIVSIHSKWARNQQGKKMARELNQISGGNRYSYDEDVELQERKMNIKSMIPDHELDDYELAQRIKVYEKDPRNAYGLYVRMRVLKQSLSSKEFQGIFNSVSPNEHSRVKTVDFVPTHRDKHNKDIKIMVVTRTPAVVKYVLSYGGTGSSPAGLFDQQYAPVRGVREDVELDEGKEKFDSSLKGKRVVANGFRLKAKKGEKYTLTGKMRFAQAGRGYEYEMKGRSGEPIWLDGAGFELAESIAGDVREIRDELIGEGRGRRMGVPPDDDEVPPRLRGLRARKKGTGPRGKAGACIGAKGMEEGSAEASQYRTLNDARWARTRGGKVPVLAKGSTQIWYMKPEYFRDGIMGFEFCEEYDLLPDPNNLKKTHTLLGTIKGTHLDHIYEILQGENWSPKGEARALIKKKGLKHTSMSVGDVIKSGNVAYMVDSAGFKALPKKSRGENIEFDFDDDDEFAEDKIRDSKVTSVQGQIVAALKWGFDFMPSKSNKHWLYFHYKGKGGQNEALDRAEDLLGKVDVETSGVAAIGASGKKGNVELEVDVSKLKIKR